MTIIDKNWDELLEEEFKKEYFRKIFSILKEESKKYYIFPKYDDLFNAFRLTHYEDIKCVIIGQDPYHGYGQANGLAFSVNRDIEIPPSLRNIYRELNSDLNIPIPTHGDLTKWANEGVFLLNAVLTVRENQPGSHKDIGWQRFTDEVIKLINQKEESVVFILWGKFAQSKESLITNPHHLILKGAHPSPLSCFNGFFGKKYFSKSNDFLIMHGRTPIDWSL
mgnify:FL=1